MESLTKVKLCFMLLILNFLSVLTIIVTWVVNNCKRTCCFAAVNLLGSYRLQKLTYFSKAMYLFDHWLPPCRGHKKNSIACGGPSQPSKDNIDGCLAHLGISELHKEVVSPCKNARHKADCAVAVCSRLRV